VAELQRLREMERKYKRLLMEHEFLKKGSPDGFVGYRMS
jgi:hypothetical protein